MSERHLLTTVQVALLQTNECSGASEAVLHHQLPKQRRAFYRSARRRVPCSSSEANSLVMDEIRDILGGQLVDNELAALATI